MVHIKKASETHPANFAALLKVSSEHLYDFVRCDPLLCLFELGNPPQVDYLLKIAIVYSIPYFPTFILSLIDNIFSHTQFTLSKFFRLVESRGPSKRKGRIIYYFCALAKLIFKTS